MTGHIHRRPRLHNQVVIVMVVISLKLVVRDNQR